MHMWEYTMPQRSVNWCIVGWGLPFVLSILPLVFNKYGPSGAPWCWMPKSSDYWFMTVYGPVAIVLVFVLVVFFNTTCGTTRSNRHLGSMKFYPIIFLTTWTFICIPRVCELVGVTTDKWFKDMLPFFAGINGFLNAAVYGGDLPQVHRLRSHLRKLFLLVTNPIYEEISDDGSATTVAARHTRDRFWSGSTNNLSVVEVAGPREHRLSSECDATGKPLTTTQCVLLAGFVLVVGPVLVTVMMLYELATMLFSAISSKRSTPLQESLLQEDADDTQGLSLKTMCSAFVIQLAFTLSFVNLVFHFFLRKKLDCLALAVLPYSMFFMLGIMLMLMWQKKREWDEALDNSYERMELVPGSTMLFTELQLKETTWRLFGRIHTEATKLRSFWTRNRIVTASVFVALPTIEPTVSYFLVDNDRSSEADLVRILYAITVVVATTLTLAVAENVQVSDQQVAHIPRDVVKASGR